MPVTLGLETNNIRKAFSDAFGSKVIPRRKNLAELADKLSTHASGPVTNVTGRKDKGLTILVVSSATGERMEHRFSVDSALNVTGHETKKLGEPPLTARVGLAALKGKPLHSSYIDRDELK
jgi:hypothetical protein